MKIDNISFEMLEEFRHLGTTLTNQNSIQEEIKTRLKSGNACYHSVQNLLSFSLLSKNLKIKIYRTIILPIVWYGCETWSRTLREERRLRVFESRVLRRIFGPKRDEGTREWRKLHNEELNDLLLLTQYCAGDKIEKNEMGWACSTYGVEGERRGKYRAFCWGNLREGDHLGDPGIDARIILRLIFRK